MEIFRDQIEQMVYEQRKILKIYTRELEKCIDGNLARNINHGKQTYYHTYYRDDRYKRSSLSDKPEIIKALARKEYLSVSIKVVKHNLDALEKTGKSLLPGDLEYLKTKMQKAFVDLPDEYFFNSGSGQGIYQIAGYEEGIRRHVEWGLADYEKSNYRPDRLIYPTSAGYKVRSKSEQHIIEQLVNYSVPHRYEEVLHIGDDQLAPDLTFRDRNYAKFYWEHAGMMDDPVYQARHERKMDKLKRAGIVPWKNLIVTYDNDGVINIPMIKSIIEFEVLPRL